EDPMPRKRHSGIPRLQSREKVKALLLSMTPEQLAPIRPLLQACDVPTAVIWGTGDIFFRRHWADWLVDLIPGADEVVEIPHGRLFFPDERAPELVDALQAHWARHGC
ncbi:MAG: alpha/beta hydrolase, partial [Actinomycetota bacterium]|nr:alpha/beta hydrolase [Actinomycetota bacterium]